MVIYHSKPQWMILNGETVGGLNVERPQVQTFISIEFNQINLKSGFCRFKKLQGF